MTYAGRRQRLGTTLSSRGLAGAYIGRLVNVRYLTGYTGSNGAVLVRADGSAVFATDGRYRDQAAIEVPDVQTVISRDLMGALVDGDSGGLGARPLGVETHALSVDDHAELLVKMAGASPVSLERVVEKHREVKDDDELAALRSACAISTEALRLLLAGPLVGRSERAIARELENAMFTLGAEAIAFDTIVAGGPNSAIPHHVPTDRLLERGDLLKIDFGARVDGYHADCTRTVVLGRAADWQREIYAAVQGAQAAGLGDLTDGADVAQSRITVDAFLAATGWLDHFTTGLGHGVGLEIHEDPFLGPQHLGKLVARTALTMEPGIYLPGRGGVRIEDTAVVTKSAPEVLTTMTKDLLELA